ncbi:MAG: ABC transporter permease [Primorskyibacter sp.]
MATQQRQGGVLQRAGTLSMLIYYTAVRNVRKSHRSPVMAILTNMLQTVIFVLAFYVMSALLGLRGSSLRGDFLIYIMTGVFLFMTHVKSLSAVLASEGPASPIMQHAPMSTAVTILAALVSALYIQVISAVTVLIVYDFAFQPGVLRSIEDPISCLGMVLLSWATGGGVGLLLLAAKPWVPTLVKIIASVYQRANMIASGKMVVANTLPAHILSLFDWNPLFHTIDQCRGYAFVNYTPRHSSWEYALWCAVGLLALGMIGEYARRRPTYRSV